MPEPTLDELIQRYLDGVLSAEEFRDLESRLIANPADADAFARACRMDAVLTERFLEDGRIEENATLARQAIGDIHAADDYIPSAPRPTRFRWPIWATAAALLIATGAGIWFTRMRVEPGPLPAEIAVHRLLSGDVLVDGERDRPIRDGSRIETLNAAAVIALSDGSQVELAPDSAAELLGPEGTVRQVVHLTRGSGSFKVEKGNRQFRVQTSVGNVIVLGTEFSVHLQPLDSLQGEDNMLFRSALTLLVAVTVGQVEVEVNKRVYSLGVGERVFAEDKPANPANFDRRADMTARMIKYDDKANLLVVSGKENQGNITFAVAKDAKVFNEKGETKLGALAEGQVLMLYLNEDKSTILAVRLGAQGDVVRRESDRVGLKAIIAEVDVAKNTITLKREKEVSTHPLAEDVKIYLDGKEAKLADIKPDTAASISFADDKKTVAVVKAGVIRESDRPVVGVGDGDKRRADLFGFVGKVDQQNNTLVVMQPTDGGGERLTTFNVSKEAKFLVDGRDAKIGELTPGAKAQFYLNDDRSTIVAVRVENKPDRRIIQTVDVTKKTVQFRAEGRDLIFPVSDDVKVVIDGKLAKLGDIPPDAPATVVMSPDRKTVVSIQIGKGGSADPDAPREGDKPVERRPDGDKPAVKPDGEKPVERRPDGEKPAVKKPDGEKPVERRPDGEKPPVKKPDGEK